MENSLSVALVLLLCSTVWGIIPSGELHFQNSSISPILVAPSTDSGWGRFLPTFHAYRNESYFSIIEGMESRDGCNGSTSLLAKELERMKPFYLVLNRGNCSFLQKAQYAEQVGALAVLIQNTREATYMLDRNRTKYKNQTASTENNEQMMPSFAFDCRNGEGYVRSLDPLQPWMVQDEKCSTNPQCQSSICVPTGQKNKENQLQVCCLWDTHLMMGANLTLAKNLSIPAVFLTIAEGEKLAKLMKTGMFRSTQGQLMARYESKVDLATIFLWLIGTCTAIWGSFYAAHAERQRKYGKRDRKHHSSQFRNQINDQDSRETLELSSKHAVYFIFAACFFLTFLYFVHVSYALSLFFAISAITSTSIVFIQPLVGCIIPKSKYYTFKAPFNCGLCNFAELFSILVSAVLAILWFLNQSSMFYLQDLFGVCLCFLFLRTIQVPNLRIASVLLLLAFVYDIFFVFITPYIFKSSIMVEVASGGPSIALRPDFPGYDYCERYPHIEQCIENNPIPMLLVLPRFYDWREGKSMLGLGDIVIPGLLLSFALRFDYLQTSRTYPLYYTVSSVGYMLGLFCANMAVILMQMGQPALLYLVPCTLGLVTFTGYLNNEFTLLWNAQLRDITDDENEIDQSILMEDDNKPLLIENDF